MAHAEVIVGAPDGDFFLEDLIFIPCGFGKRAAFSADVLEDTVAALASNGFERGLKLIAEGFIDRRYRRDGHLQSRSIDGAVIKTHAERMAQLHGLITTGEVETAGQNIIKLACDSLCLHSDSAGALETAASARDLIEAAGVLVCAAPRPANNNAAI